MAKVEPQADTGTVSCRIQQEVEHKMEGSKYKVHGTTVGWYEKVIRSGMEFYVVYLWNGLGFDEVSVRTEMEAETKIEQRKFSLISQGWA